MKKLFTLTLLSTLVMSGCMQKEASITVINQDRAAEENVAVTIEDSKGNRQSMQTDAQGMVHPKLSKGDHTLTVNKTDCEAKYEEVKIQVSKEQTDFVTEINCE